MNLTHIRRLSRDPSRDDGSIAMTLLVVIVTATLATTLVASTISGQRATQFDQRFTQSLTGGDAGVQQALFELNTGQLYGPPGATLGPFTTAV
ncbi:MAG: hypothetical protein ACR2KP_21115, partial [Egibacteraceae bacterium]